MNRIQQMRAAISDTELALGDIAGIVEAMDGASDAVMVRVQLGALRRLAKCYDKLNRITNNPDFDK